MSEFLIESGMYIGKFVGVYEEVLKDNINLSIDDRAFYNDQIKIARRQPLFSILKIIVSGDYIQNNWVPPKIIN